MLKDFLNRELTKSNFKKSKYYKDFLKESDDVKCVFIGLTLDFLKENKEYGDKFLALEGSLKNDVIDVLAAKSWEVFEGKDPTLTYYTNEKENDAWKNIILNF